MELVAASKMKRAQVEALKSRPFAQKIEEISRNLSFKIDPKLHPLLTKREKVKTPLVVLLSPSRGLCGPLVASLLKSTFDFTDQLKKVKKKPLESKYLVVERKGKDALLRSRKNIIAYFEKLGDKPEIGDLRPIIKIIIEGFLRGEFDEVYLSFTRFISTLTQKAEIVKVLPIEVSKFSFAGVEEKEVAAPTGYDYLFEPSADEILEALLPQYLSLRFYQAYMEAIASEHSARMVSMKNATDNAEEVKEELTLEYNKSRQAAITKEIVEIASASEAQR